MNRPLPTTTRLLALRRTKELVSSQTRDLEALLPYFDEVVMPVGSQVAVEGDRCTEFVIVVDGLLKVCSAGTERSDLRAGDSIGWYAMWERGLNEATVVVEEAARLLVMSHAQFRAVKSIADPPARQDRGLRKPEQSHAVDEQHFLKHLVG
jgi:CRP-like cAMP-binding protein